MSLTGIVLPSARAVFDQEKNTVDEWPWPLAVTLISRSSGAKWFSSLQLWSSRVTRSRVSIRNTSPRIAPGGTTAGLTLISNRASIGVRRMVSIHSQRWNLGTFKVSFRYRLRVNHLETRNHIASATLVKN